MTLHENEVYEELYLHHGDYNTVYRLHDLHSLLERTFAT